MGGGGISLIYTVLFPSRLLADWLTWGKFYFYFFNLFSLLPGGVRAGASQPYDLQQKFLQWHPCMMDKLAAWSHRQMERCYNTAELSAGSVLKPPLIYMYPYAGNAVFLRRITSRSRICNIFKIE